MNDNLTPTPTAVDSQAGRPPDSLKTVAVVVYALQAIGYFVGITALIGVIIAHIKIGDARGTWLESHFRWQIRTFWYSLLWGIIGALLIAVLVGYLVLAVAFVWSIYRVAKGWLRLIDGKAMYTAG
ncbi:MAG TPA: hypothetical protein VKZ66_11610 [Pusillimonas sp.]|uniref:DUF4870 family protein n=1 Tax=unclassified Pusillimonas TaxID=2640016 RepID=UPI0026357956|nr:MULTISPECIES: hypothetical protein [unclassified Pusillimonas]HLU20593.1 hypothetical protein [Pusillimonas sp.]